MNGADTLSTQIDTYLASRRQAGFALHIDGQQLKRFAAFTDKVGHRVIDGKAGNALGHRFTRQTAADGCASH